MRCLNFIFCCVVATTTPIFAQITQQFDPDSLTRGLWHFNEVSGSVVADTSSFRHDGTAFGTTIATGRFGNARSFNGYSDYVSIPSSPDFDLGDYSFRVDVWFKTTATEGVIVRRGLSDDPGFMISVHDGHIWGMIGNIAGRAWPDTEIAVVSSAAFNDDNWHLASLIRDREAGTLSLLLDGTPSAPSISDSLAFPLTSTRPISIGCWIAAGYQQDFFAGTVDEVRITSSRLLNMPIELATSPTALRFDFVRVLSTDSLTLNILNVGKRDTLRVTSITCDNPVVRFSNESYSIPAGDSAILTVYYSPTAAGRDTATLALSSNDPQSPLVRVPVYGRAYVMSDNPIIKTIRKSSPYYWEARLVWIRSILDTTGSVDPVEEYSIWRRVNGTTRPVEYPPNATAYENDQLWDFLGAVPAVHFDEYTVAEPLSYDYVSIWNVFMVAARTRAGQVYFSPPDSIRIDDPITSILPTSQPLPTAVELYENYPNPFNPATTLSYDLPLEVHVRLTVFDILGRIVAMLVDERQPAGKHSVVWDASSSSSGIYFYRLQAGGTTLIKKMLLVK